MAAPFVSNIQIPSPLNIDQRFCFCLGRPCFLHVKEEKIFSKKGASNIMANNLEKSQRLLVSGFVRNAGEIYNIKNIPTDINTIIHLFLKFYDHWSQKYSSDKMEIDNNGLSCTVRGKRESSVFGTTVVETGVFVWRIEIEQAVIDEDDEGPFVGIIVDDPKILEKFQNDDGWDNYGYQLCAVDGAVVPNGSMGGTKTWYYGCKWHKTSDILEISLDLNERTLSFKVNDKDYGVAYKDIEKRKYRLVLTSDCDQTRSIYALV